MSRILNVRGASSFNRGQEKLQLYNRSGGASLVGGVYILDTAQGDADSTSIDAGLDNALLPTTALVAAQSIVVIAQDAVADNIEMNVVRGDANGVICQILVESTTDIAKGDKLKPVNGQAYGVKATVDTDKWYAEALEARTTNDTGLIAAIVYHRLKV